MEQCQNFKEIQTLAKQIRSSKKQLIVVGTGGSSLGAQAVISALGGSDSVVFVGDELCEETLKRFEGKDIYINYISKSGKTLEPKLVFERLRELAPNARVIYTTSNPETAPTGTWKTLIIPKDVGGRFSVFTPAGLLPISVAGFDVKMLVKGAKKPLKMPSFAPKLHDLTLESYAVNLFVFFQKRLEPLGMWLCQLFNESAGKDRTGIFCATAIYPRDLHSLGQIVQDGPRKLVQTFISFNDLYTKKFGDVNRAIYDATFRAHVDDGVPVLEISAKKLDEFHLGALMQFYMEACVEYCEMLNVNPFDQPGVENYKKNLQKILQIA